MNPERAEQLLQGYAFGKLTPEELEELSNAALEDDNLFAKMAHADDQRRVLSDPEVRQEVLNMVREAARPEPAWKAWFASLLRPAFAVPLAAVAMLLAIVVFTRNTPDDQHTPAGVGGQGFSTEARQVADLPVSSSGPALIISNEDWINTAVAGDRNLAFQVTLNAPAALIAVQQFADGRARFIEPESLTEPVDRQPGEHRIAFEASPPDSGITGPVRIIVAVLPPGVDVRLPGSSLESARAQVTVREIRYVVRAP